MIQQYTSETVMISVLGFPSEPLDTKTTKSRSDWMIQGSWSVTDDASPNGTPEYWMKVWQGKPIVHGHTKFWHIFFWVGKQMVHRSPVGSSWKDPMLKPNSSRAFNSQFWTSSFRIQRLPSLLSPANGQRGLLGCSWGLVNIWMVYMSYISLLSIVISVLSYTYETYISFKWHKKYI